MATLFMSKARTWYRIIMFCNIWFRPSRHMCTLSLTAGNLREREREREREGEREREIELMCTKQCATKTKSH